MTACAEAAKEEDGDDAAACRSRHSFGGPFTGLIFRRQLAFNACHAVEAEEKYQPGSPPGSASWLRQPSQNPSCSLHPRTHRCSKESLKDSERRERGNSSERRRDRCGLHRIVTCARSTRKVQIPRHGATTSGPVTSDQGAGWPTESRWERCERACCEREHSSAQRYAPPLAYGSPPMTAGVQAPSLRG
jgi:hypothetical protein